MRRLILIIHNVRSAHNVGSLLRTAEGLGIEKVYITGYSPYPLAENDERLPHISRRAAQQIDKTALGAAEMIDWQHHENIGDCLDKLKSQGFLIAALEQTPQAKQLAELKSSEDLALVVGNEVEGLDKPTLANINLHLKIPMLGRKESFNVAAVAAMALYHLRYIDK
jgi:23S rRNA (guanosine2251-2'-O)-methyltransferase